MLLHSDRIHEQSLLASDQQRRVETNYPKPVIHEKNYDAIKSNPKYYTPEGEINWPPNRGVSSKPPEAEGSGEATANEIRKRVLENIENSRAAREASNVDVYLKNEENLVVNIAEHKLNMGKIIDDGGNFNLSNGIINGGKINERQLNSWIPPSSINSFRADPGIIDNGFKYNFIYNGTKVEIKWHSPQLNLSSKLTPTELATSNSYNGWTAQIKISNKYLGADGNLYRNNRQNNTHIPVNLGR